MVNVGTNFCQGSREKSFDDEDISRSVASVFILFFLTETTESVPDLSANTKVVLWPLCFSILLHSLLSYPLTLLLQALLKDPLYIGLRHRRVRGQAYDDLLDEFMRAVSDRYDLMSPQFMPTPCIL